MEKNREDIYCDIYNRISILKNKTSKKDAHSIKINAYVEDIESLVQQLHNNEDENNNVTTHENMSEVRNNLYFQIKNVMDDIIDRYMDKYKNSETLDILIDINNYIEELKEDEGEFDNNEDSSYDFGND